MAPQQSERLTAEHLASLKPEPAAAGDKPRTYDKPDVGRGAVAGLRLRVTSGGAKSWVLLARFPSGKRDGKPHNPTRRAIGSWPAMTLPEARDVASTWNTLIAKGIDPQEHEAKQREAEQEERDAKGRQKAQTFANVAARFIAEHVVGPDPAHPRKRTANAIKLLVERKLVARWRDRPVTEITRADVRALLKREAATSESSAHQTFAYLRTLFSWAIDEEIVPGLVTSPCDRIKPAKTIGERKARQRVLTDNEVKLIWRASEGSPLEVYPFMPFIRLLLILGCRRGELAAATRGEIDLGKGTWALTGERTKTDEPRIVPLPRVAIDILAAMPITGPYLFSTTHGRLPIAGFSYVKDALDAKIAKLNGGEPIAPWRLHDLRRTMRTNLSAISMISPLVAELMIGHAQRGVLAVYDVHRYADEQRAGFEAWASRLRSIVEPQPDNVVAFRP
jgi:integrase